MTTTRLEAALNTMRGTLHETLIKAHDSINQLESIENVEAAGRIYAVIRIQEALAKVLEAKDQRTFDIELYELQGEVQRFRFHFWREID